MTSLKIAVVSPAVIHLNDQLLVVGYTGSSSTNRDVQYLSLASNTTGVYADTIAVLVSSVPKATQRALAFFQPRPELT